MSPILQTLGSLSPREVFTFHKKGDFIFDYWSREVFEFLGDYPEKDNFGNLFLRCFTTEKDINSAFFLPADILVFPIEKNRKKQISETQSLLRSLELENSLNAQTSTRAKAIFLKDLSISDRFYTNPLCKERFLVLYEINDSCYWASSELGTSKTFKKDSIVYV